MEDNAHLEQADAVGSRSGFRPPLCARSEKMRPMRSLARVVAALIVTALVASPAAAGIPLITSHPEPVHFDSTEVGNSTVAILTLTNRSAKASSLTFEPEPPDSPFTYLDTPCLKFLAPHHSCIVTVRFTPRHPGPTSGSLVYRVGGSVFHAYAVHLVGTAREPAAP